MYLLPLNADYYFKKVFSRLYIAKRFLEDFLDVTIEHIEFKNTDHKLTHASAKISFDFRCKINGKYCIIEMQLGYKGDVIKRFYLYQAVGTVLQLEEIPMVKITEKNGKKSERQDYNELLPVITIVWLAVETFNFDEEIINYSVFLEQIANFVNDETLWAQPLDTEALLKERRRVQAILNNPRKNLLFHQENRIIYAFQKNIVKSKKFKKYAAWFRLAEKSSLKDNQATDFDEFKNETILMDVMNLIQKNDPQPVVYEDPVFTEEDARQIAYIHARHLFEDMEDEDMIDYLDNLKAEVKEEVKAETKHEAIKSAYERGIMPSLIADVFELSLVEIEAIIASGN